jgi:hypothetical protein
MPKPSVHVVDAIFFRAIGLGLLYNEARLTDNAQWELIVAAICMFLMPDFIRGKDSLPSKVVARVLQNGKSNDQE